MNKGCIRKVAHFECCSKWTLPTTRPNESCRQRPTRRAPPVAPLRRPRRRRRRRPRAPSCSCVDPLPHHRSARHPHPMSSISLYRVLHAFSMCNFNFTLLTFALRLLLLLFTFGHLFFDRAKISQTEKKNYINAKCATTFVLLCCSNRSHIVWNLKCLHHSAPMLRRRLLPLWSLLFGNLLLLQLLLHRCVQKIV
jgi:hypothetical protein